jgi:hypothetical protein
MNLRVTPWLKRWTNGVVVVVVVVVVVDVRTSTMSLSARSAATFSVPHDSNTEAFDTAIKSHDTL